MKKSFFPILMAACLGLAGCKDNAADICPEQPLEQDDPGNSNWVDTLRPPLNPFIIENERFHRATKEEDVFDIINKNFRERREKDKPKKK